MMIQPAALSQAIDVISAGGIIAYPTESVYGLGCDPFNHKAVETLLKLKQRPVEKGMILIASHIQQILPLIQPDHPDDLARALKTWPGHHSWVFPKTSLVPDWISGQHQSIAIRVSNHPVVKQLCDRMNAPLVSTSANLSNQDILTSIADIRSAFGDRIGNYIDAPTGGETKPSTIRDAHSGAIIR